MEALLQRHRSLTVRLHRMEPKQDIKGLLDDVVLFLNKTAYNSSDGRHLLSTICTELSSFTTLEVFNDAEIMNHPFFAIIQKTFQMLLVKLTFVPLTDQDTKCIEGLSLLISGLCFHRNKISSNFFTDNNELLNPTNAEKFNVISYEKVFFPEPAIRKFARFLEEDIAVNNYELYHVKYRIADRILRTCIRLCEIDKRLVLDAIIKCVESKVYTKLYKTVDLSQLMVSPKQLFFMYECPRFLRLCSQRRQDDISTALSKSIVKANGRIIESHLSSTLKAQPMFNQTIAWYIELLNHLALTPTTRELFIRKFDMDRNTVDQMIEVLKAPSLIKSVHKNAEAFHPDVALVSYSITLLYNLTFEKKIFFDLKEKNLISVCEQLYAARDETIQFAARTLGAILNQEDIDEVDSPSKVARSYVYFIEHTIDDLSLTYHGIRLDGVLTNLETVAQNDNVKEEIVNDDNGIPLLARCACDQDFDVETIQRPALRIIDAISFENELSLEKIRDNDVLMEHVKELSKNNDQHQGATANRILWKAEGENEFISKQKELRERNEQRSQQKKGFDEKKAFYQYVRGDHHFNLADDEVAEKFDLRISYCPDEKQMYLKIFKCLKESGLYNISFDEEVSHGFYPERMAKEVENSSIVLLCVSSKYRTSYACRLEAGFAKKRNRTIIPVKIDHNYDPTGWLQEIINDNNDKYLDFTQYEFNVAYAKLVEKIQQVYENTNQK